MKHLNLKVLGRVQGVGFRYSALRAARSYGIKGFVRNEPDGSVYMEVEGEEMNLGLFLDWCSKWNWIYCTPHITLCRSRSQFPPWLPSMI